MLEFGFIEALRGDAPGALLPRPRDKKTWTEDGSYVDAHRSGTGHENISAMIQGVQEQLPGYRLRLASAVDAYNDRVRFQWEAGGTAEAPLHFLGTDFGVIANDG